MYLLNYLLVLQLTNTSANAECDYYIKEVKNMLVITFKKIVFNLVQIKMTISKVLFNIRVDKYRFFFFFSNIHASDKN